MSEPIAEQGRLRISPVKGHVQLTCLAEPIPARSGTVSLTPDEWEWVAPRVVRQRVPRDALGWQGRLAAVERMLGGVEVDAGGQLLGDGQERLTRALSALRDLLADGPHAHPHALDGRLPMDERSLT